MNILKVRIPDDVKNILTPLCEQYGDIFALDSDKMIINNFYEQKLRITDLSRLIDGN